MKKRERPRFEKALDFLPRNHFERKERSARRKERFPPSSVAMDRQPYATHVDVYSCCCGLTQPDINIGVDQSKLATMHVCMHASGEKDKEMLFSSSHLCLLFSPFYGVRNKIHRGCDVAQHLTPIRHPVFIHQMVPTFACSFASHVPAQCVLIKQ